MLSYHAWISFVIVCALVSGALVVHHPIPIILQVSFMNANLIEVFLVMTTIIPFYPPILVKFKNCSLLEP